MDCPCDLNGAGVLVTRPAEQADKLCRLIAACGGRPIVFPALEIRPTADPETARILLTDVDGWDLLVFVSRNAVAFARRLLGKPGLPRGQRLAAVGRATAEALADAWRAPDLVPTDRFDSETLLAMDELQSMAGKRVLIVRGHGGRALLGDTLTARGAEVAYAEVYQRVRPDADPLPLLRRWANEVHWVTITSNEILQNLSAVLGPEGAPLLRQTPLVVISERMGAQARRLGCARVRVAAKAEDEAILATLCKTYQPAA
jgi:uroporphyrinogen-III synthase